jgi:hypothetical protein
MGPDGCYFSRGLSLSPSSEPWEPAAEAAGFAQGVGSFADARGEQAFTLQLEVLSHKLFV